MLCSCASVSYSVMSSCAFSYSGDSSGVAVLFLRGSNGVSVWIMCSVAFWSDASLNACSAACFESVPWSIGSRIESYICVYVQSCSEIKSVVELWCEFYHIVSYVWVW